MKNSKLQVTISTQVKQQGEKVVKEMGFNSLQDYVRVAIANIIRTKHIVDFMPVRQATEEEERAIAEGMDDIRKGRYQVLRTREDIEKFYDGLHDSDN